MISPDGNYYWDQHFGWTHISFAGPQGQGQTSSLPHQVPPSSQFPGNYAGQPGQPAQPNAQHRGPGQPEPGQQTGQQFRPRHQPKEKFKEGQDREIRAVPDTNLEIPPTWSSDEHHWDNQLSVYTRLPLRKNVKELDWSRRKGIANVPLHQVPLTSVLHRGIQEESLRHLSNGQEVQAVITHHVAEAVLANQIITMIHRQKWNVDLILNNMHRAAGQEPPDKYTQHTAYFQPLVDLLRRDLEPYSSVSTPSEADRLNALKSRIQELERERETLTPRSKKPRTETDQPTTSGPDVSKSEAPPTLPTVSGKDQSEPIDRRLLDPSSAFPQGGQQIQPLQKSAPSNNHRATITKWIKDLAKQHSWNTKDIDTLDAFQIEVSEYYKKIKPASNQPNLQDVAARWGLPVSLCTTLNKETLLKVCATSAFVVGS